MRILRALRFASTYQFDIDNRTSKAIHSKADTLNEIAAERIRVELCKLLSGKGVLCVLMDYADMKQQFDTDIINKTNGLNKPAGWHAALFEVGVDSGQAGFFDDARFKKHNGGDDESFYEKACDTTLSRMQAGVIDEGAVCNSGYGDGGYVCIFHNSNDEDGLVDFAYIIVNISTDDIESKYTLNKIETCYFAKAEEVSYWRKEYDIQDWFHENLSVQVENTGYYILDENTIDEFNKAFPDDAFDAEEPTDDSALFYWEWY